MAAVTCLSLPGEDPLVDGYAQHDLDSVAGVLKLYFRGLEKPLFPCDIVPELLATARKYIWVQMQV